MFQAPSRFGAAHGGAPRSLAHQMALAASKLLLGALASALALLAVCASPAGAAEPCPNEAFRTGYSKYLPECRAYEKVSPAEKNGGNVAPQKGGTGFIASGSQAAASGEAVSYQSYSTFPGSAGAPIVNQYLARRGPDGWASANLDPPNEPSSLILGWKAYPQYQAFSPNLSTSFMRNYDPPLAGAPAGFLNLYLRNDEAGRYTALTSVAPSNLTPGKPEPSAFFEAATPNWGRIVFISQGAYLPNAASKGWNIYESSAEGLRLVNVLPNGSTAATYGAGNTGVNEDEGLLEHAISTNGSRIFWTANNVEGANYRLYVRENGAKTVEVDASHRTLEEGSGGGIFQGASANGSVVFFTDENPLTNNSHSRPHFSEDDLYAYKVESRELVDLTPGATGAGVEEVLGTSEDGSYIYFLAKGDLAPGATGSSSHLYLWHEGELRYIAAPQIDETEVSRFRDEGRTQSVSANGRYLVFVSTAKLTGYDNEVASGSSCGRRSDEETLGAACTEVYLYDAATNKLVCASCNPTGARPIGPSTVPGQANSVHKERYLLNNGTVFFDSYDALSPRDTNGTEDVYEYREGTVSLLSSGTGSGGASFSDASESGSNVFFVTQNQLLGSDTDQSVDLYDARVNGGFPEPASAPAPCSGETCRLSTPANPAFLAPVSTSFSGPGDLRPTAAKAPSKAKHGKASKRAAQARRARNLARALRMCTRKPKAERPRCKARARRRYGHRHRRVHGARAGRSAHKAMRSNRRGK